MDTHSHALDRGQSPLWKRWGRIEETEGDGDPIGRPTVSTNLDPWELPETKPPTKEQTWSSSRSLAGAHVKKGWPFLASVGKVVPNPVET